jgi:hypothetical protein
MSCPSCCKYTQDFVLVRNASAFNYDNTGLQWFHCLKYFISSLSISAPDLSITYSFLTELNSYFHERDSREPKVRTIALYIKCCKLCILFSPLLHIFFILLINYTIVYFILLLFIYEYHYALYVFHHNFLATLYKFLTWYKKVNNFLTQRSWIIEHNLLKPKQLLQS